MLRKLAAALVATTLIAAPAFAAPASNDAGAPPAVSSSLTKPAAKPTMTVKHVRKHRHIVRHKIGKVKVSRHFSKKHHIATHAGKPVKPGKTSKTIKTTNTTHG